MLQFMGLQRVGGDLAIEHQLLGKRKKKVKLVQPLWKIVWWFLKKLKMELSYDPTIPLLGIHPEKNMVQKDTCTPMFIVTLFTIAEIRKQAKCLINR